MKLLTSGSKILKPLQKHVVVIFVGIILIVVCAWYLKQHAGKKEHLTFINNNNKASSSYTCDLYSKSGTCRSSTSDVELDPVNKPEYNVKEVLKNTLLIEQHLSEKTKYCKACLVKHFLLSIALLDEAVWMAGKEIEMYPKLEDSCVFYDKLFKSWHEDMDDDAVRLETLNKLRAWRQEMIDLYYF